MAWTYSSALSTNRDRVRFLIGDTDTNDQQLQDSEIDWVLTQEGNVYLAAAKSCQALAAKYSRQADSEVGDLAVKKSQRAKAYFDLAKKYKAEGIIDAPVFAASLSVADKQTYEQDTDIPAPKFFIDMQEFPGQTKDQPDSSEKELI